MATAQTSSGFLSHINGIRALAILGVVAYHLQSEYCPAGYFGVDVFLVISGFLLFRSLMNPDKAPHFQYGQYLLGKAWRILPSWFVCTLVVVLLSSVLMVPRNALDVIRTASASACFRADYYVDGRYDYFNDYAHLNALLHFWYLSITEQLYIVAPLLVIPVLRWRSSRAAAVFLYAMGGISLLYYIACTSTILPEEVRLKCLSFIGARSAYYHLFPRFWEIVAGYLIVSLPALAEWRKTRSVLSLLALVGLLLSYYMYTTGSPYNYLAVLSAMLLVRYGDSSLSAKLLNIKPLQFIGTISFSLYLWHWPVMVFWKYFCFSSIAVWDEVGMLLISLILGYAAWRWVERRPIPAASATLVRRLLVLLSIPLVLITGSLCSKAISRGEQVEWNSEFFLGEGQSGPQDEALLEGFDLTAFPQKPVYCGEPTQAAPEFLLIGDSHSLHLYPGLHEACRQNGKCGIATNNQCVPLWNCYALRNWDPSRQNAIISYLKAHPQIRYVLISMYWKYRLEYGPNDSDMPRTSEPSKYCDALRETCMAFKGLGLNVILLEDTPLFSGRTSPLEQWERSRRFGLEGSAHTLSPEEHEENRRVARPLMQKLMEEGCVHGLIDLSVPLQRANGYPAQEGDEIHFRDRHHLTPSASHIVGRYLVQELLKLMQADEAQTP